jgi:dGTPase
MTAEARQPVYAEQRDMLTELATELARRAPEGLEAPFAAAWAAAADDGARLRVVVDQVASLTDTSAVLRRERLGARR